MYGASDPDASADEQVFDPVRAGSRNDSDAAANPLMARATGTAYQREAEMLERVAAWMRAEAETP